MELADRLLVEEAKADCEAFGLLYDRYVDRIYRFVLARLANVADAEDVTAEVFVKALRNIHTFEDRGLPIKCWLYRIAERAIADHFRHRDCNRELTEQLSDGVEPLEARTERKLEAESLWRLVGDLPPCQRTAMILRFGEDLSCREAAQRMGRSEAAVKQLIYRAVAQLRSRLERRRSNAPAA